MMLGGIISRQCGDGSWALLLGSSSHMPTNRASDRVSLNKYGEPTNNPGIPQTYSHPLPPGGWEEKAAFYPVPCQESSGSYPTRSGLGISCWSEF